MSPARTARPALSGLLIGLLVLAATLAGCLGAQEAIRRERVARAQDDAMALAETATAVAAEWLGSCRRTTRFLARQAAVGLAQGVDVEPARAVLEAGRGSFPDALLAAVLAAGDGRVIAADEDWREGSAPAWLAGSPAESGIVWRGANGVGRFVAREAMVAPPDYPPPLWLVTVWEPTILAGQLKPLLHNHPDALLILETVDGVGVVQLPTLGRSPDVGVSDRRALLRTGLQVRAVVAGPAALAEWPWIVAVLAGIVAGLLAAGLARRRERLARDLEADLERVARGEKGGEDPDGRIAHRLPGVARALDALRNRDDRAGTHRLEGALARLRGGVILVTDPTGTVELVVGEPGPILGRSAPELTGGPLHGVVSGGGWRDLTPILARAALEGEGTVSEIDVRRPGGTVGRVELTITARERGAGYVMLARDTGETRGLVDRLEIAEARYRGLLEGMQDGLAVVRDGRIERANPALATMLGLRLDEVEGSPLKRYVASEDIIVLVDRLRRLPAGDKPFDLNLVRADSLEPVEVLATATPLGSGEECLLVVRDQTDRRRSERGVQEANVRLDATLDATSDAVVAMDGRDSPTVILANRAFGEMFGLRAGEPIGMTEEVIFARLVRDGRLPESFRTWVEDGRRDPAARRTERFDLPEGTERRALEVCVAPVKLPGGSRAGRVFSFRDVTTQAEAERRLREDHEMTRASREFLEGANRQLEGVNRDLEERTRDLDEVNRRLKQLDEMRSNLLANVSHELQTPLVSIRGYTEMILKGKIGPVTPDQQRGLEISLKNIDRLIGLIDNLLEFSRAEGRLSELKLSTFRLRDLLDEVLVLMRESADRRKVSLHAAFPGGNPLIRGDRDQVGQVFVNLLSNGIKFNRDGGEVTVEVGAPRKGFARVIVRDTGAGVPREDLERIFERYYRAEGQEVEGTGLGLSITRHILRMHGCTIQASLPDGGGSAFSFTLPLAREDETPESSVAVQRRHSTGASRD